MQCVWGVHPRHFGCNEKIFHLWVFLFLSIVVIFSCCFPMVCFFGRMWFIATQDAYYCTRFELDSVDSWRSLDAVLILGTLFPLCGSAWTLIILGRLYMKIVQLWTTGVSQLADLYIGAPLPPHVVVGFASPDKSVNGAIRFTKLDTKWNKPKMAFCGGSHSAPMPEVDVLPLSKRVTATTCRLELLCSTKL